MGTNEYAVEDGNGNELVIACPTEDGRYVSASITVNGQAYRSEDGQGFDLIVDGKTFRNPFTPTAVLAAASSPMSSGAPCVGPNVYRSALKARSSRSRLRISNPCCRP